MDIFLSIARNGALLLSLVFVYSLLIPYLNRSPQWLSASLTGLLFGAFAILNMLEPMRLGTNAIIDPRNTILLLAAMVGGYRAGIISLLLVTVYRFSLGSEGFLAGWMSMLTASILGIVYQRYRKKLAFDRLLIALGIVLAIQSLLWTLILPDGKGWELLPSLTLPVLLIYPSVTYIMAWLIVSAHQRIELSASLQESEARFRTVFEQSLHFLCLMDADGRILSLSPSLVAASRLKESDMLDKKLWEVNWLFMPHNVLEAFREGFMAASEGSVSRQRLDLSPPGQQFIIDVAFQKIGASGQIFMEARDITQQMQSEKHRLELQFERERNDILQQLISDASHHLRTPLTVITSSLYLLRKQSEQAGDNPEWQEKMEKQFKRLDNGRQELVEIVEDLLSMMQLDSPSSYRFERIAFPRFLIEIIESYQSAAEEKQIRLQAEIDSKPFLVSIVPKNFRLVIVNLLENALRYTPAGGRISLSLTRRDAMMELLIEDTGIGIPQEDLPRIYDRFFRAKNASSQSLKGTGLGLAIVKKTIEMHKGQIEISSELGKGTRVIILIPLLSESVLAAG